MERMEQAIWIFDSKNELYEMKETRNQRRTKKVLQELLTLKQEYEQLTDQEIQTRFKKIIRKNPATKPKTYRKGINERWRELRGRISGIGRKRKGGQD